MANPFDDPDVFIELPDLTPFCSGVSTGPGGICVTLPGDVEICAQFGIEFGDTSEIARSLFGQINSALTPLSPMFDIIDCIMKVVECLKAIPDAITQLSPTKISDCIPGLLKQLDKLLNLLPPIAFARTAKGVIQAVAIGLLGMKTQLQALIRQNARIIRAGLAAAEPGNFDLLVIVDCATGTYNAQIANLNASMAPLNRLLGIVSTFMQVAGLPAIKPLDQLGPDAEKALIPLDIAINALTAAAAAIP